MSNRSIDREDLELIAEYVQKGIQQSKQEVSILHREIRDDIKSLKQGMDKFDERLDSLEEKLSKQEEMLPTIEAIKNITWTGKILVALFISLGAMVGALVTIQNFIKNH